MAHCTRDIGWLKKDLKVLRQLGPLVAPFARPDAFLQQAESLVIRTCFGFENPLPLRRLQFLRDCEQATIQMRGLPYALHDQLLPLLELRNSLAAGPERYPGLALDLRRLMPPDFLNRIRYNQLPHLLRYLRGLEIRAARAAANPEKDRLKAQAFTPYRERLDALLKNPPENTESRTKLNDLFWLIEEFRVSIFAQELGTARKASPTAIEDELRSLDDGQREPS